jgi:uncharacterized glyoxalase superfamily protein PhnB
MMNKLTPVLAVDAIEPALPFWCERLGFQVMARVPGPGNGQLAFVILQRDAVEVMLQTRASIAVDVPRLATAPNCAALYLEVADIEAIARSVDGEEIVVARRRTDYGADEIGVRAPGGHLVLFAQMRA